MENWDALKRNLMDTVKEYEMKLGYGDRPCLVNYTKPSLQRLLGGEGEEELAAFLTSLKEEMGEISVQELGDIFCLTIPVQGVRFVHERVPDSPFWRDLIALVQAGGNPGPEEIRRVFDRYSDHVHFEVVDHPEFQYLAYFEDGVPDAYRYCFDVDFGQLTYHRYTREDYEAFGIGG